jgi:3-oxoacyl-[acyl-carrier protein] reductase
MKKRLKNIGFNGGKMLSPTLRTYASKEKTVHSPTLRLDGKKIFITGVSRPLGIGATLAKRFAEAGAAVAIHGFSGYDLTVGNLLSSTPNGTETLAKQYQDLGLNVTAVTPSDFTQKSTAAKAVEEAAQALGGLDGLILNHCYGTHVEIGQWTEDDIDPHLSVNIRAAMMMVQAFAMQVDPTKNNAVTLFTSGQHLSPMTSEMAYCVAKEALICLCRQAAWLLKGKGIRVNTINPGANDTGYYPGDTSDWSTPDDAADLVLFLHSTYAKWITGQVISSDGGMDFHN